MLTKQNRFKNLSELHKEWTEAGVKASGATTHRHFKEFGYSCRIPLVKPLLRRLTWAKRRRTGLLPSGPKSSFPDESKFCISFGNQGPRVWRKGGEAHSPSCLKSSVKFPQYVIIWGAMSSAGVGPLCFLKTKASLHPFTKKFWSTSCFRLLTSFLKMLISFSSRIWHLPTLPKAPKVG
uniref:Transposase n=1 Tax=Cyprinus carpio carpio TaxID=630221 RepID=A0A9J8DHM3_CYPCA